MIYLHLHDRLGNMMFMIAAALHVDSDVRVFCHNENDSRYVARMIDRLGLPVKMEAPKQSVANRWEYFMPTVYKSIVYRGGATAARRLLPEL
jgi:lysophospholipid acyltransferase (LPLAT)-like uncharacterized protein